MCAVLKLGKYNPSSLKILGHNCPRILKQQIRYPPFVALSKLNGFIIKLPFTASLAHFYLCLGEKMN
jgi:hypothetical protein